MAGRNFVTAEVSGLRQLGERLAQLSAEAPLHLRALLEKSLGLVVVEARARAGEYSDQTPDTIIIVPGAGDVAWSVQAGNAEHPIAALLERGAHSRPGKPWRHPMYGNRNAWGPSKGGQALHPYLVPAELATREEVTLALSEGAAQNTSETIGQELPE